MIDTFVFDTNSLISAYLIAASKSRMAYEKGFVRGILIYSEETFDEFINTFIRSKFEKYLSLENRLDAIKEFRA